MSFSILKTFALEDFNDGFDLNENCSNGIFINYCCGFIRDLTNSYISRFNFNFIGDEDNENNNKYSEEIYKLVPTKDILFILFFKTFMDLVCSETLLNNYIIEKFGELDIFYNELYKQIQKEIYNYII